MHLDRHVVKMIIEYAQLLSTAHRVLDGTARTLTKPDGKSQKMLLLPGETTVLESRVNPVSGDTVTKHYIVEPMCYNLSHQNHPSAVWARETSANYDWLASLFLETSAEYTHRYGRIHKTWSEQHQFLVKAPKNIKRAAQTDWPQAMGDEFKVPNDAVAAYQNYYLGPKAAFAKWTNRTTPAFFKTRTKDFHVSDFERTRTLG